jgi:hypothetical protein
VLGNFDEPSADASGTEAFQMIDKPSSSHDDISAIWRHQPFPLAIFFPVLNQHLSIFAGISCCVGGVVPF